MKAIHNVFLIVACFLTVCWASDLQAETEKPVHVSAAASLGDVLKAIDLQFEKQTGIRVELNLAASNALARQIEEGAPADVFFSADQAKMERLEKKGLIDGLTKKNKLSNRLVVAVPVDSELNITTGRDLTAATVKRIAIGNPRAVPVGLYAKDWLVRLGLWDELESRFIFAESVRGALAAVESGNVDVGIVYKTDTAISRKVKIALEVPESETSRIIYPLALVKEGPNLVAGKRYLEFLDSKEASALFRQFGFIVLE